MGPTRQEERFDLTWVMVEISGNLELAWLEWLRAAEADWCRIHDLCGAQRGPFLGRNLGLVIENVSYPADAQGHAAAKRLRHGGLCDALWHMLWAKWQPGGRGE